MKLIETRNDLLLSPPPPKKKGKKDVVGAYKLKAVAANVIALKLMLLFGEFVV